MRKLFTILLALAALTGAAGAQTTPNIGLNVPPIGSSGWGTLVNENFETLDLLLSGNAVLPSLAVSGPFVSPELTTWSSVVSYGSGAVVFYQGTQYYSKAGSNLGNLPTNATYWTAGGGASGTGTVTSFSFPSTLGALFSCSVANPTTTPAVTCSLATATASAVYATNGSGVQAWTLAPAFSAANLTNFPTLNQSTTGNAATSTALAAAPTRCSTGQAPTGVDAGGNALGCAAFGTGTGTVTTFSAGSLSPLFTANVANATTTPALTFTLSNAAQNSVLAGPSTGGAGPPSYQTAPVFSAANLTGFPTLNQSTTGNAATATALAGTPTGCTSGQSGTGIGANGNAQGCTTYVQPGANSSITSLTGLTTPLSVGQGGIGASSAAAHAVFGNFTAGSAAPSFSAAPVFSAALLTNFPTLNQSTTGNAATATLATTATTATNDAGGSIGTVPYQTAVGTTAQLAANTNNADAVYVSHGTGTVGAAPSWKTAPAVSAANMTSFPTLNQNTTGNAATATSATSATSATTATNVAGGAVGSVPYQTGAGATGFLAGNAANTDQVYVSHGTGSAAVAPTLSNAPALSAANMTSFPTLNQSTTGNAATSIALAATPTLCSSGQAPTGVDAHGNATGCAAIGGGGGPPTGTAGGVLSGSYPNPALNANIKVVNGRSYSTAYSGSTVDVRVNACLADAIGLLNGNYTGICDASGETGTQVTAATITVGSNTASPVTLLVPSQGQWRGGMTDGTSWTLTQYGNSSIVGAGGESGIGTQFVFGATATSSLGGVFQIIPNSTQINYVYDANFAIVNVNGGPYVGHATTGGVGASITGPMYDNSTLDHMVIFDALDAQAAVISNWCCGAVIRNLSINGNYGSGVTPLTVTGTSAFNAETLSVVHPGSGKPALLLADTTFHTSNANIESLYIETSNSDTTTALIQAQGMGSVFIGKLVAKAEVASDAAPIITSNNTTNTGIIIAGATAVNGGGNWLLPVTMINNSATGKIVQGDSTTQKSNLGFYASNSAFFDAAVTATTVNATSLNASGSTVLNSTTSFASATAATSSANSSSPQTRWVANYWTGTANATDNWIWNNTVGTGANPTSTWTQVHTGSSGLATVSAPYPWSFKSVATTTDFINTVTTITASATPAIVASNGLQTITLSANATPTVSGIAAGQYLTLQICQPSSGGPYTWTWPAAFVGGISPSTISGLAASACVQQTFKSWDGSTLTADNTQPAGLPGTINSGGVLYGSATNVVSSSAVMTANSIILGGGAGTAPKTVNGITTDGTSKLILGQAGTSVGGVQLYNGISGSVTLQPINAALGTVTASLPANTGTLAELNLAQTWTANQTFSSFTSQHISGAGTSPTIAAGAGAGTTATVAMVAGATDYSGYFTLTTGSTTAPAANGTVVIVTFNTVYGSAPPCSVWPANATTASLVGAAAINIYASGISTSSFTAVAGNAALAAGASLEWGYRCG